MVMKDTRNRKEAEISNVNRPTNPLFPFDKAVYRKLKSLYDEVYAVDAAESFFSMNAKAHSGKIILPAISVYRLADYSIARDMTNDWVIRSGYRNTVKGDAEFTDKRIGMHILPVTLTYQIDIWATRRDVAEGITAELLLEFCENPHMKVDIQDMGTDAIPVEFDFLVEDNVVDNSSVTEFDDSGRFYRLTLNGTVPYAMICRVDVFKRINKEVITFEEFIQEGRETKEAINKVSHQPKDTLIVDNGIDEYGRTIYSDKDSNY